MGSLNIPEWSPDQVAEWMLGLGPKVAQYVPELRAKGLNGAKLLTLRCDDLEYLGINIIGHQELLLEAVEHLRNFHYELSRECVQQLAVRVSTAAASLARALRHHADARLETHSLADVARTVHAVKPLVCWLDRWPLCSGSPLAERKAALLKLSLEAATCAQRDRFAEQPARAVAAAAAAVAQVADYIIQDVSDPMILQPASLDAVSLRQGTRPLGFEVVPSFCGHHQLADIRFASPAHASGLVHEADEIVQAGSRCVLGWSGEAVERECVRAARATGELQLRLRRRGGALPALPTPPLHAPRPRAARLRLPPLHAHLRLPRYEPQPPRSEPAPPAERPASPASSSGESEPLSPPASPTQLHLDTTRMYPPKPQRARARRHSVSGGSPLAKRAPITVQQFWQELQQRWVLGGSPEPDDAALYRRDKAVSCSTGLQLSPRPRTCHGVPRAAAPQPAPAPAPAPSSRGKLDKSHSTPAYDFELGSEPGSLAAQTIPESPTTPVNDSPTLHLEKAGQILDFKKSSSQIEVAILQQRNRRAMLDDERSDVFNDEDIKEIDEAPKLEIVEAVNAVLSDRIGDDAEASQPEDPASSSDDQLPVTLKYIKPRITERFPPQAPPTPPPRPPPREPPPPPREPPPPPREPPPRDPPPPPREVLPREPPPRDSLPPRDCYPAADVPVPVSRSLWEPPPRELLPSPRSVLQSTWEPLAPAPPYPARVRDASPRQPARAADVQTSLSPRSISKSDIMLVSAEPRQLPAINGSPEPPASRSDIVLGADSAPPAALSPAGSVVRGIFPSSKSRSLKKKNSMLAKRRAVPARSLAARGAAGRVWQRVRARGAAAPRWAARHLLLAYNTLYAYRSPECNRADCMIYLEGFTVCAAGEVKSRAHAFKVYHTGTAFYFACDSRDAMLAWIQLIHRATLLPSVATASMELSKQFSETDYSETESDTESSERRSQRDKERDKDKSKFGSLKKLTHRASRSESQENVSQAAATSLDRKYLRFFSRARTKDDNKPSKSKQSGVPVPTEHYRSYRRVPPDHAPPTHPTHPAHSTHPAHPAHPARPAHSVHPAPVPTKPKPINYIHASNPNLLDFEKSDFVTKPAIQVPKPKVHKPDNFIGFVTLEEFMLKKQEEERQQLYTNRVLMGIERDQQQNHDRQAAKELQQRLDSIVPDVIYGELPPAELPLPVLELQARQLPSAPAPAPRASPALHRDAGKPISVKGKDGYEKIVYPEERQEHEEREEREQKEQREQREHRVEAWRASLRRADKVHSGTPHTPPAQAAGDSWASGGGVARLRLMFSNARRDIVRQESSRSEQYAHLQCPPTFQPETYSLARPPRDPRPHKH
ncbi:uncharacterized protein LOC112043517 [Bicyclus anynana]|uniref:Uncharacterized protein LOC112043517 n=1 Tax=Bicyclus anynana TaxID=110368 RepID=A0A6J1MK34_BICAN|nr:uncharacterized protein LOC112043517 [Bicyclus anynana]